MVSIDLAWRNPQGRRREASLQWQAALTLGQAIERNRVEVMPVEVAGFLITVSAVRKAELRADSERRIKVSVGAMVAPTLGPYYNQRVWVQLQQNLLAG